jgi:hypothetical protein
VRVRSKAVIPPGTVAVPVIPRVTFVVAPLIGMVVPLGMLMVTLGAPAAAVVAERAKKATAVTASRTGPRRHAILDPMFHDPPNGSAFHVSPALTATSGPF